MAKKIPRDTIVAVLLVIIVILLALILLSRNNDKQQIDSNASTPVSIAPSGINYPTGWGELEEIALKDKQAGVVSVAEHDTVDAKVVVRTNQGELENNFDINKTLDQIVDKLGKNLKDFKLFGKDIVQLGKNKAIVITYQFSNNDESFKHTQIIVPTAKKTYYLTLSAVESEFKKITDFSKIQDAFSKYIASH